MSLRQKVKLELEDGNEVVVEYSAVDLRAWEVQNRKSALDEPMSVTMLSWLGWNAARRQGLLNGNGETWEAFDPILASVEGVSEGPTRKAATRKGAGADSSAPSP